MGPSSATPGSGQSSTGANRVYISEFADTTLGNFMFEFVEIFVDTVGMQKLLEGGFPAKLFVALDIARPRRETGAPQQQDDAR